LSIVRNEAAVVSIAPCGTKFPNIEGGETWHEGASENLSSL